MKSKVKEALLSFIILFSILIPYSLTVFSSDIAFEREVTFCNSELNATVYKGNDFLFSEFSDDIEKISLTELFSFCFLRREEFLSLALRQSFSLFQKIPFKLLSIPPPSFS
ncbi:MAG TPA: hypothetical protein PLX69_00465 [Leptospiraceae bacterium]|nr:hypothetical protein [Leptospiraceae bacterium]HRG73007.1 hypothetical protein [Leptospiraceae bacterium]